MPSDSSALHGDGEASMVGNASACRWRGDHRMGELIGVRGRKGLASGACTLQWCGLGSRRARFLPVQHRVVTGKKMAMQEWSTRATDVRGQGADM
jgi:hypothetical protein